jgi:hypothetical protein
MTIERAYLLRGKTFDEIVIAKLQLLERISSELSTEGLRIQQVQNANSEAPGLVVYLYSEDAERNMTFSAMARIAASRAPIGRIVRLTDFTECPVPAVWETKYAVIDLSRR